MQVHKYAAGKTGNGKGRIPKFPVIHIIPDPMLIKRAREIIDSGHGYTRIIPVSETELIVK